MSLIRKPSQLKIQTYIKSLFYGQPGIGKSTLALSAPEPLLFDFDAGVHRIAAEHLKPTVQIEKWEDVQQVLDEEDLSPFQTLIFDTAGKMIDYMTEYITRKDPRLKQGDGSLSLKGYGARKVMFQQFFARISMLQKHVVLVAHEREEKDGDTRYIRPEIGGSSGNDLMKELDIVGYLEAKGQKRTICFNATEKFYGKNTCKLPDLIEIPDLNKNQNDFLKLIFAQYEDMISEKIEMMQDYNVILEKIDEVIAGAKTVDDLNGVKNGLLAVNHIWDSKLQAAIKLRDAAKAMGFILNKQTGNYEVAAKEEKPKTKSKKEAGNVPDLSNAS